MIKLGYILYIFVSCVIVFIAHDSDIRKTDKGWKMWDMMVIDLVNPKKWWWLIRGEFVSLIIGQHVLEQIMVRTIKCEDCVKAGKCWSCGCHMPEKAYVLDAECSEGKWGVVEKSKAKWEERKKEYKFKLGIIWNTIHQTLGQE